jgi:hypothetical protein
MLVIWGVGRELSFSLFTDLTIIEPPSLLQLSSNWTMEFWRYTVYLSPKS